MIKRVTFLMLTLSIISVMAFLCFIKQKPDVLPSPKTNITKINDPEVSDTSEIIEDSVFDRVAILRTKTADTSIPETKDNTVTPAEFEFGEYLPVVFFNTLSDTEGGYYTDYAVLGYNTLEDCAKSFNAVGKKKTQELYLLSVADIEAKPKLEEYKNDVFYNFFASDTLYSNTSGLTIKEIGLSNFEITTTDGYYRISPLTPATYPMQIEQIIDNRYYLVSIYHLNPDKYTKLGEWGAYLYDIKFDNLTLLEKSTFNPMLSPDMKYLIYTDQTKKHSTMDRYYKHQERGFYVKNLETSETVFYPYPNYADFADYGCINWIKAEDFKLLLSQSTTATLDSTTQKFFENTRSLPEKDEDIQTVVIPFPEDFPTEQYQEPPLTSPEDFEFGDYMLRVSFSIGNVTASDHVYTSAFLGEGINTIEEGRRLFNRFEEKYITKYPVNNYYYNNYFVRPNSFLGSYLFNSSVGRISTDGRLVTTESLLDATDDNNVAKYWYSYDGLMMKNDIYLDGELISSELDGNYFLYAPFQSVNLSSYYGDLSIFSSSGDYIIDADYYGDAYIFSKSQNKWIYRLALTNVYEEFADGIVLANVSSIEQMIDDRYLLLSMVKSFPDTNSEYPTFAYRTYLYDMVTAESTYLGNYFFDPIMSPDKRYIAYQSVWYDIMSDINENNLYSMRNGFFILDLETKKTVFYDVNSYGYPSVGSWISKSAIDSTIAHEGSFVSPDVEQREDIPLTTSGENTKKISLDIDPQEKASDTMTWVSSEDFEESPYIPIIEKDNEYNFISGTAESELYTRLCERLNLPTDSKLVYVSEECDRFVILVKSDNAPYGICRLINGDGNTISEISLNEEIYNFSELFDKNANQGYIPPIEDYYYSLDFVDDAVLYSSYSDEIETIYVYDGNNPEPLYEITMPRYYETDEKGYEISLGFTVESLSLNGYAILCAKGIPVGYYGSTTINARYFVNLNTQEVIPISRSISDGKISPDGRFMIGEAREEDNYKSYYVDLEASSYLKYPHVTTIGWVSKDKLISFINSSQVTADNSTSF